MSPDAFPSLAQSRVYPQHTYKITASTSPQVEAASTMPQNAPRVLLDSGVPHQVVKVDSGTNGSTWPQEEAAIFPRMWLAV